MKTGIELITEERQRQIEVEGWTKDHDKKKAGALIAKEIDRLLALEREEE